MHDYFCSECGAKASVQDGKAVRTCIHETAAVLAPRTSMLYGEGGVTPQHVAGIGASAAALLRSLTGFFNTKGS